MQLGAITCSLVDRCNWANFGDKKYLILLTTNANPSLDTKLIYLPNCPKKRKKGLSLSLHVAFLTAAAWAVSVRTT